MRNYFFIIALIAVLQLAPLRRALGEDRLDVKYMYYKEDGGRIGVQSPTALYETDLSPTLNIKIEGVYNSISGASPTGLPAIQQRARSVSAALPASTPSTTPTSRPPAAQPSGDNTHQDDHEGVREDDDHRAFKAVSTANQPFAHYSGASSSPVLAPASAPAPAQNPTPSSSSTPVSEPAPVSTNGKGNDGGKSRVPTAKIEDERWAFNLDVTKRLGDHSVGALLSYSTESDYESVGFALRDAVDFNKKNTTLLYGGAYTFDKVDVFYKGTTDNKDTLEGMVGLTQVLSPRTLFTVNLSLGQTKGFLADPYKMVELNGKAVPEVRPDSKDRQVLYLSLNHLFSEVDGAVEASYRYYNDSFGIQANTYELAWYQSLSRQLVLRPMLRWYEQTEADFYDVSFTGSPEYYSSDYRVSALQALGYGLKLIWTPNADWSLDVGYERYEQKGTDGITPDDAYPSANFIMVGVRRWL